MTRWTTVAWITMTLAATAGDKITPPVKDALAPPPGGAVRFEGWIGEQIETCRRGRLLAQSIPDVVQPFAVRDEDRLWRCEFWGKWFTSAALAHRYRADAELRAVLDRGVNDLLATQTPDGYIGTYKAEARTSNWDVWGRKYTLLGLLAYDDLFDDARVRQAAGRHADHTLGEIGPGKADIARLGWWGGLAAGSILEPMVLLHRRTGETRYREFADYIVRQWETPEGPQLLSKALAGTAVFKMFPGPDPAKKGYMSGGSSKAYEMMSCYEGLLELHRVTGDPRCREAVAKVFANIRDTEITILGSGSSWERWCNGRARQAEPVKEWMETCVTVTWIKLAGQLLRLTGEPGYADEIERATYNALLAAQKDDGSWWCHYNPLEGVRESAPEHCGMHMNCCVANGPRGLMLLPELAVMGGAAGPVVNLYEPGEFRIPLATGGTATLRMKSDYPRDGVVEIEVQPEGAAEFTLSLRVPAWSRATKIEVNGGKVGGVAPGAYARIARTWKAGDRVRATFDLRPRLEREPGGSGRVAVMRGPVVFALDRRLSAGTPGAAAGALVADAEGVIEAGVVREGLPAGIRMALDVPFKSGDRTVKVRMCDYASAGHTWSDASMLRVWLPQPLNLENPLEGVVATKSAH